MNTINKMLEESKKFRGEILHAMCVFEKKLDIFISKFFCSDEEKSVDMLLFMIGDNRMPLDNKRQVFHAICKKYYKDWYASFGGEETLNKCMVHIIEQRNILAHCPMDQSDDAIKEFEKSSVLKFFRFKDSIKDFKYSQKSFLKLYFCIFSVTDFIDEGIDSLLK